MATRRKSETDAVIGLGTAVKTGGTTAGIAGFFARSAARPLLEKLYERAAAKGNQEAARAAAQALAIQKSGKVTDAKARLVRPSLAVLYQFAVEEVGGE
jgi:hypothetical protein